jgi:predicted nucleotidyltransferase
MEMPLAPDFKEFLSLLNSEKVEYLLVGGYAVSFYGYPRPTGDLDIWIAISKENGERVQRVVERFGFPGGGAALEEFLKPDQILRMGVPPIRIEILTGVSGVRFSECYKRRTETTIDTVRVSVIAREDLLANKRAAGRHKDLNDLEHLGG